MHITDLMPAMKNDDDEPTTWEKALEERAERIKFHRDHVRNGPVKWRSATNGQIRRERQRAIRSMQKKTFRKQVRQHFSNMLEAAILRGKLQSIGILECQVEIPRRSAEREGLWLIAKFADRQAILEMGLTSDIVEVAFLNALQRYEKLSGLPVSDDLPEFYEVHA